MVAFSLLASVQLFASIYTVTTTVLVTYFIRTCCMCKNQKLNVVLIYVIFKKIRGCEKVSEFLLLLFF